MYAYEKLVSFDCKKAQKALENFNKTYKVSPASVNPECEKELIEIVDNLAKLSHDHKCEITE